VPYYYWISNIICRIIYPILYSTVS
jgi:hypothetical protein